jgi:4-hydroxy-2-oxoheptanedioate aldolase
MITNPVRERIRRGEAVAGVFVSIESPTTVELLALAGVDFVVLDSEHYPIEPSLAAHMFRAAEAFRVPALARIGENTQQVIAKFMDAGCLGVMMPMVNSADDARRVVSAVKYPPLGRRGLAGVRANAYGMAGPLGEHAVAANEATLVIAQIETAEGIEHAADIIAVPGVDVVFLGPSDLSVALGVPGQSRHEKVLEVIERLARGIVAGGRVAGTIARSPEEYAYWRQRGVGFFLTGANVLLATAAAEYVRGIRAVEATRR